jgi:hypothetical protein
MTPHDYALAALMALLVLISIRRFLKHGTLLHTTLRSMMINDPFILAMPSLVWYDYVIAAIMALLAFSILFPTNMVFPSTRRYYR